MSLQLDLGDLVVDVVLKDIKNLHLSVHPPAGRVRISAPKRMGMDTIRAFVISKLDWIRRQQTKLRAQERETPRDYVDRESHYVWGKRYLLTVTERDAPPCVELQQGRMHLQVRPLADSDRRHVVVEAWLRERLKDAVPPLLDQWQPVVGARVERFYVRRMKTKWGSCTPTARTIRLNTELAKKPPECLEYVLVHELVHLLEPSHNARFHAHMDRLMPDWRFRRRVLNRLPVPQETGHYPR